MPIVRTYQPPFEDVMSAAQTVGAGEYAERRRREDLALTELAQRDLAQRRAIVADQQRQAQAIAAQQQEQAARMQLAGWQAALNQQNIQRNRQWDLDDRAHAEGVDLANRQAANQEWERRQGIQFENDWMLGGVEATEKGINADLAGLLKAKEQLTPEGVKSLGNLLGKWRAIQAARGQMPPGEYGRMMTDFADEVLRSGVHDHVKPPPDAATEVKGRVVPGPDGNSYILQPNGEIRPVPPPKPVENKMPATFEERYQDFETFQKDFDAERKRLETQAKTDYDSAYSQWEAGDQTGAEPAAPTPPTKEQVLASMREKFAAYQSIKPASAAQPQPTAAPVIPAPPMPQEPLPAEETDTVSGAATPVDPDQDRSPEGIKARLLKAGYPEEKAAKLAPIISRRLTGEPAPPPAQSQQPVKITSDREHAQLPPGALYQAPDGSIRRKAPQAAPQAKPVRGPAPSKQDGKDLKPNKADDVRRRTFERDDKGLVKKEVETYTDPATGELVTVEQIVDRDENGRIVGSTSYLRRKKAESAV